MTFTDKILAELRAKNPPPGFTRRILSVTGHTARIALSHLARRGLIRKLDGLDKNACRYELLPEPTHVPASPAYNPLRPLPKDNQLVLIKTTTATDIPAVYNLYQGFIPQTPVSNPGPVTGWRPITRFS